MVSSDSFLDSEEEESDELHSRRKTKRNKKNKTSDSQAVISSENLTEMDRKERMEKALSDVRHGMSFKSASKKYQVPRTTLRYKYRGVFKKDRKGPVTVLPEVCELTLVRWIKESKRAGFPVTKIQLCNSVQDIVKKSGLVTKFVDGKPGDKWFQLFLKRHPDVTIRTRQHLTPPTAATNEIQIQQWFKEIREYFSQENLEDVLKDPKRVYSCDETAFFLTPKDGKVLAPKGDATVYSAVGNDEKENVTVLFGANGSGTIIPPMMVLKYERIPKSIVDSVPAEWAFGKSETGWMTVSTFYEYLSNVFNKWLESNHILKPVVLYVDGHASHISIHISEFCSENGIVLVALPPNSTRILQPMDVGVFHPLKSKWKIAVEQWRTQNEFNKLKKENFCSVLKSVMNTLSPECVQNAFRTCGLYPFEEGAVDYSKLINLEVPSANTGGPKISSFKKGEHELTDTSLYNLWKVYVEDAEVCEQNISNTHAIDASRPEQSTPDVSSSNINANKNDF